MPKNKGKGGKNRRRGKNENDNEKRELVFREEGQGSVALISLPVAVSPALIAKRYASPGLVHHPHDTRQGQ